MENISDEDKIDSKELIDMEKTLNKATQLPPVKMVVVNPYDKGTLESVSLAYYENVIIPILVGQKKKIIDRVEEFKIDIAEDWIVEGSDVEIPEIAASLLYSGEAKYIMKGMISTADFMHVLLEPKWKIRTERILSHVGMFEMPKSNRVFLISDAAINILPNFTRKIHIIANAVDVARKIGLVPIRIAMLAAVEKVKLPAMPATLDAFLMKKFANTGYFGDCYIEGPYALDNALDPEKAATKGLKGEVAGKANILITPNIETGNVIWKIFTCVQKAHPAGVVMGGRCPIVVPSRADDYITKLRSIKFAKLLIG